MTIRETQLEAALSVNAALWVQAERLIAAYVAPESDRGAINSELVRLFDGAAQRVKRNGLRRKRLGEGWWKHRS
jgi:hypothetical protein